MAVALIDHRIILNGDREMSESEWTKLLIERGEAILAEPHRLERLRGSGHDPASEAGDAVGGRRSASEDQTNHVHRRARATDVAADGHGRAVLRRPSGDRGHADGQPLQHAPILERTPKASHSPERRRSLQEMATRLTGKRRSDDENTS
jgi:hypothetical protein